MADDFEVWRCGITASYWQPVDHPQVRLSSSERQGHGGMEIDLRIPSKGGGTTKIKVWINASQFYHVVKSMYEADKLHAYDACQRIKFKETLPKKKRRA